MESEQGEILKPPVSQFVIIDFDRTLGNSNAIMKRFYGLAEAFGLNSSRIFKEQEAKEQAGESFDPLASLREALGNDENRLKEFKERFIAEQEHTILYEDAKPFLKQLRDNNMEYGVVSYGSNEWQDWKLAASGLQGRKMITGKKDKGTVAAGWQQPDGSFEIEFKGHERVHASSVCIIDDKKTAFAGIPEGSVGFWLQRLDAPESTRTGEFPANRDIQTIDGLKDLNIQNQRLVTSAQSV